MCFSKALTGGIMPMAITSCTQQIYDAFYDDEQRKGLFHGHTYSGSPLGCAVASAAIDLLVSDQIQQNIQRIAQRHEIFITENSGLKGVKNLRTLGVILAFELDIEIDRYGNQRNQIFEWFWQRGLFIRPLGATLYVVPPFTITTTELERIYGLFTQFAVGR